MCKIAVIPGITDETSSQAWRLIKALGKEMTFSDDDGFGYAALDSEGNMFGERWYNPKEAFLNRNKEAPIEHVVESKFKGFIKATKLPKAGGYNSFGDVKVDDKLKCAILHARKATCAKTMENLHPFVIGDTALIHNGVIHNTKELTNKVSTCDSECILNEYIKFNVANNLSNLKKVVANLDGYYACGIISKMADGTKIIDVFKDNVAKLRGYYIKELGQVVFGTTGHSEQYGPITSACRDVSFTITEEYEIPNCKAVRINAMTGEVIEVVDFDGAYKGKNNRRGNVGGGSLTVLDKHGSVLDKFTNVFGASGADHKNMANFTERQKEDELERMLVQGDMIPNYDGYEVIEYKDGKKVTTPIPNDAVKSIGDGVTKDKRQVWEQDFEQDSVGVWHKRSASNR
jgi:hypothetical protein